VQEHVFFRWCDWYLEKQQKKLVGPVSDWFDDGTKLCYLVEEIGRAKMCDTLHNGKSFFPYPKDRAEKEINARCVIQYCKTKGSNIANVEPSDIVDGKEHAILSFLWQLNLGFTRTPPPIRPHAIKFNADGTKRDHIINHNILGTSEKMLLKWCQFTMASKEKAGQFSSSGSLVQMDTKIDDSTTNNYSKTVNNFSTDWKDGLALISLIHNSFPTDNWINGPGDFVDLNDPAHTLKVVFNCAEHHLGVPQLLNIEDLTKVDEPDAKSIMAYVNTIRLAILGLKGSR